MREFESPLWHQDGTEGAVETKQAEYYMMRAHLGARDVGTPPMTLYRVGKKSSEEETHRVPLWSNGKDISFVKRWSGFDSLLRLPKHGVKALSVRLL